MPTYTNNTTAYTDPRYYTTRGTTSTHTSVTYTFSNGDWVCHIDDEPNIRDIPESDWDSTELDGFLSEFSEKEGDGA